MIDTIARAPLVDHTVTFDNRVRRLAWNMAWTALCRLSPVAAHGWRRAVLRTFGASVGAGAHVYPRAAIWAPWNLRIGLRSCLADGSTCYNVAPVVIGDDVVVSQDAYLCTASHDYNRRSFPLVAAPVTLEAAAWVAAGAFVSPGVTVHRGGVVGARAVVTRDVAAWTVVAGNPARVVNRRTLVEDRA